MLSNLFTLDQLKTFYTIVQTGSFKKAANNLYISQPTVSIQIKKLEYQLNKNCNTIVIYIYNKRE